MKESETFRCLAGAQARENSFKEVYLDDLLLYREKRVKALDRKEGAEQAIDRLVRSMPAVAEKPRAKQNLAVMAEYSWLLPLEREEADNELEAAFDALELGMAKQAALYYYRAEDRMFFDYSNKAVVAAERAGLSLRPLAKLRGEPAKTFVIKGPQHDWRFTHAEEFERPIPPAIIRMAKSLRDLGIGWQQAYIGEPFVQPLIRIGPVLDPILAVNVGPWLLEVGRW